MNWLRSLLSIAIRQFLRPETDDGAVSILAVVSDPRDRNILNDIARREKWALRCTASCDSAVELMRHRGFGVILLDRNFTPVDWRAGFLTLTEHSPRSAIILLSREIDDRLWLEVIERGGFDVIIRPIRVARAVKAIRCGWDYYTAQPVRLSHDRPVFAPAPRE
jgi:DNA-binding response OmpR family regulator